MVEHDDDLINFVHNLGNWLDLEVPVRNEVPVGDSVVRLVLSVNLDHELSDLFYFQMITFVNNVFVRINKKGRKHKKVDLLCR